MDRSKLNAATRGIPIPDRMQHLPINDRGFIVPWFVAQTGEREWDFRAIGPGKVSRAVQDDVCWLCGRRLGRYRTFTIGPMCAVNRVTAEPPSHKACCRYAVKACPFLTMPKMVRNEKDMPIGAMQPPGEMIERNPGVTLLWTTLSFQIRGGLFHIGPPNDVEWWAHGRRATREEVVASVESGLPILAATCEGDAECLSALASALRLAEAFFPLAEAAE